MVTQGTVSVCVLEYMFITSYWEPMAHIMITTMPPYSVMLGRASMYSAIFLPSRASLLSRSIMAHTRCIIPMKSDTFSMSITCSNVSSATEMTPTSQLIGCSAPPSASTLENGAIAAMWCPNTSPVPTPAMAAAAPDMASSMPHLDRLPWPFALKSSPIPMRSRPCPRSANMMP